jgi:hypothetical protein
MIQDEQIKWMKKKMEKKTKWDKVKKKLRIYSACDF